MCSSQMVKVVLNSGIYNMLINILLWEIFELNFSIIKGSSLTVMT